MPYTTSQDIGFSTVFRRGLRRRCPSCGEGRAFSGYLTIAQECDACGEQFGHIRADDFPPYITILLVGHIIVPTALMAEQAYHWETGTHMAVWLPLTVILSMSILPVAKGVVLGMMWRLGLSGSEQH